MMNILLTVHQFMPDFFAGTEILTFSVARELIKRGHRVSVLTGFPDSNQLSDHQRFDEYKIDGIEVFRFHHAYTPMGTQSVIGEIEYNNQLAARYFAHLIRRVKPDIVHFFHLSRLGFGLIDVAAEAALPAYYTPTDFWSVCPTAQLLLENGRVCAGPTRFGGNCIKHVASRSQKRVPMASRIAKMVPCSVVEMVAKLTIEGFLPRYPGSSDVAALGKRRSFNIARLNALHGIICPTQIMSAVLTSNGVDERLIVHSAFGIDLSGYQNHPTKARGKRPITFGFIGTLGPYKGCHVLIEAFKHISNHAKLRIYGNFTDYPDYFKSLERQAAGIGSIEFCGTFPNSRVAEIMAGLDVLVVPSVWYENTPLVIYSALAAKCPVVASNFPGMSEAVRDNFNGLVFPPGNADALREKLLRLINEPALVETLSANCAPPKSIAEYVDGLLALYDRRDVIAGRGNIAGRQTIVPLDQDTSLQPV